MAPKSRQAKGQQATAAKKMASTAPAGKRKRDGKDDATTANNNKRAKATKTGGVTKGRVTKVTKEKATGKAKPAKPALPVINSAPKEVLQVLVCGTGDCGELGLGEDEEEAAYPTLHRHLNGGAKSGGNEAPPFGVVQLACGGMHTLALTDDGQIVTWGVNDEGALGRNTSDAGTAQMDINPLESTPTAIPASRFPEGTKFTQVAAGDSCSLALTDKGEVYAWGTFTDSKGDKRFLYHNGTIIQKQAQPFLVPGLKSIKQICCGANHAMALDSKGNIWAWGVGEQNQLGRRISERRWQDSYEPRRIGISRNNTRYIASGQFHSFAVDGHDAVWAWGLNSFGEAGYARDAGGDNSVLPYPMKIPALAGKGVTVLDGGAHHSAAVTADGECLTWGRVDGGQLGIDFSDAQLADEALIRRDESDKPRICLQPAPVAGVGKAVYVSCGTDHTIFVGENGKGYGSGFGSMNQLGNASSDDAEVAEKMVGQDVKKVELTWCGAGGQFSMVAGRPRA